MLESLVPLLNTFKLLYFWCELVFKPKPKPKLTLVTGPAGVLQGGANDQLLDPENFLPFMKGLGLNN